MEPYWHGVRRLFLLWAVIIAGGFTATYLMQNSTLVQIDGMWIVLSVIGLAYTKKQLPWSDRRDRGILLTWLILIACGIAVTQLSFSTSSLSFVIQNVGPFWLLVMALGHAITGMFERKKIYIVTTLFQVLAAVGTSLFVSMNPADFTVQYLFAGAAGALSMIALILYA